MRFARRFLLCVAALALSNPAFAGTVSFNAYFVNDNDLQDFIFTISAPAL